MENSPSDYVLVTGGTGLIGSHVVDNLLNRGCRVRMAIRSQAKANAFLASRPGRSSQIDFAFVRDLTDAGAFDAAVDGVSSVIHVASPLNYSCDDNEEGLIIPAIKGVRSILKASLGSKVRRIVMTSSFGAILDMGRPEGQPWRYSAADWNPITYKEATAPGTTPQDAYRGSKTFAEQEAWKFMETESPSFDLVTLCPSMVFGPLATPPSSVTDLNESNKMLWKVLSSVATDELPPCRFNFWIDVRDLAEIHVQALKTPAAGGRRYIPVSKEPFTYQMASEYLQQEYPQLRGKIATGEQGVKPHVEVDHEPIDRDMPIGSHIPFRQTVLDFSRQFEKFLSK
ncbi:Nucleoside-diphosphate-sugar epimerase [Geosmithia morbida]|uniref:Nucleoside-diphosphate-sugar epimerase n=1 Tax=Geosmithia morbida TaxID=1094350 RepID=A0A9P5D0U1_9HYPO|nr:Nucleoside-diphosphate-sugar epimerase [Geosmithia morbida]KAF4123093.1 Nucleoside-diphosphate-sugar epimerase [Geosmithia morbida]